MDVYRPWRKLQASELPPETWSTGAVKPWCVGVFSFLLQAPGFWSEPSPALKDLLHWAMVIEDAESEWQREPEMAPKNVTMMCTGFFSFLMVLYGTDSCGGDAANAMIYTFSSEISHVVFKHDTLSTQRLRLVADQILWFISPPFLHDHDHEWPWKPTMLISTLRIIVRHVCWLWPYFGCWKSKISGDEHDICAVVNSHKFGNSHPQFIGVIWYTHHMPIIFSNPFMIVGWQ